MNEHPDHKPLDFDYIIDGTAAQNEAAGSAHSRCSESGLAGLSAIFNVAKMTNIHYGDRRLAQPSAGFIHDNRYTQNQNVCLKPLKHSPS